MLLSDLLKRYCDEHEDGIKANTLECYYKPALAHFERHLGRAPKLEDLNTATVSRFVEAMKETHANRTAKSRRSALLALWRWAANEGLTEPPRKIRKVKPERKNPRAWSPEEVARLIRTAQTWKQAERIPKGSEIPEGIFYASLFAAAWDTALRLGDVLAIAPGELIRDDGGARCVRVMSKTGFVARVRLSPETLKLIDSCLAYGAKRELIWPLPYRREQFYRKVRLLVALAGIDKGTTRFIRRGAVTAAENEEPGAGSILAHHRNRDVTWASYIDQTKLTHKEVKLPTVVGSAPVILPFRPTASATIDHRTLIDRLKVRADQLKAAIEPAMAALEKAEAAGNHVVLRDAQIAADRCHGDYARLCAQVETVLSSIEREQAGATLRAFHEGLGRKEGT